MCGFGSLLNSNSALFKTGAEIWFNASFAHDEAYKFLKYLYIVIRCIFYILPDECYFLPDEPLFIG